jgi:hypothetical protein
LSSFLETTKQGKPGKLLYAVYLTFGPCCLLQKEPHTKTASDITSPSAAVRLSALLQDAYDISI